MNAPTNRLSTVLKADRWMVIGLFALGVLSRLPFRSRLLYHWDSVNFALAIEHFDVRLHQPHPPGTFVIYVMLGRVFNWFLHDPNGSLVWISVLTSGLSAALIFVLGKLWFDRRVGLTVALLMLTSPLLWFHGEVALSYMLEFFWVIVIVMLCFGFLQGNDRAFLASALCLGLAGGIRPNTPVFLFPLWAVLVFKRRPPMRKIFVALVVMAVGVAIWAIPMVVMSGGPAAYWDTMQWWSNQHLEKSGESNVFVYTARFGVYALYALGFAVGPILWGLYRHWRDLKHLLLDDWRAQMLAFWIAPGAMYFTFVHLKQAGHTFTIMPAFVIVAGLATAIVSRDLAKLNPRVWITVTALIVVGNGLLFLLGPANLFGSSRSIFSTPTWASIREYDVDVSDRLEVIRETFGAEDTAVLASSRYFRLPDFYLKDYQMSSLSYEFKKQPIILPEHVHTLVLFDDLVLPQLSTGPFLHSLPLPGGKSMRYVTWDESEQLEVSKGSLDIEKK
jgi:hypothetical protein